MRNGRAMDHLVIQFNTYVPLDLVQRPAAEKVWEVFATDGPGRGCRPAAMADLIRLDVEPHGVTAAFPGNIEIFVPNTSYMAVAGHPAT